jgi:hypothetical protein
MFAGNTKQCYVLQSFRKDENVSHQWARIYISHGIHLAGTSTCHAEGLSFLEQQKVAPLYKIDKFPDFKIDAGG